MPTLAILDGHSIAYRAFFALPEDLATTSGQVTNAVYGFTRMLIKLLSDHHPDAVTVAWDLGRQTFRSDRYPDYKAQRRATPDAFKSQLPLIREVLEALHVPQLAEEGYEADDIIATVARRAAAEDWDLLVVTGDRDAFQLISDAVKVVYTRRGISDTVLADRAYVEGRYGIPPDRYVEYAALRGDTSDNLPGVPGVGEKTASRLVAEYGNLEGIFDHVEEQTPKLRENLASHRDQVFLNRSLMKLVSDMDLALDLEAMRRDELDRPRVKELFTSLEFHSLWEDLLAVQPGPAGPAEILEVAGRIVADEASIEALSRLRPLVVDGVVHGEFRGLGVLEEGFGAAVVPLDALGPLTAVVGDPTVPKLVHDGKTLARMLREHQGLSLDGISFDTALAAYVLDPAARAYQLEDLAERYLGIELVSPDRDDSGGGVQGAFDFSEGPDVEAAGRRLVAISRLEQKLRQELDDRDELQLYSDFELPLIGVLVRMEEAGIGVDRDYLEGLGDELRSELVDLEARIHQLAGEPFNVNSTDQLREVLFDKLGLPVAKKTSTGKPSTDASVLEKLDHPIVECLLRYRELEKLRSTYVDGYLPLIGADGRIHTRFNQMAAATGRLSSEEPNLQNIPVRSEVGRTIRRAFVPAAGHRFVVADYSQIELRVLAHMSRDQGLIDAFTGGEDIHNATAARVFEVEPELVSSEMRRRAKVINFGLLYGMEAFGLASRLDISRDEARAHMDAYFSQFPDVAEFMSGVVSEARRAGYTATLFGRRRYLPELKSDNFRIRQMGERMALNAPVQGTAADIIKKAMIDLDHVLLDGAMGTRLLLQVHDELVLEAPEPEVEQAAALTEDVMESVVDLVVPLRVDVAIVEDLAAAKG